MATYGGVVTFKVKVHEKVAIDGEDRLAGTLQKYLAERKRQIKG